MTGLTPDLIAPLGAELLEAPVWDAADESLLFVDIPSGTVHRWSDGGGVTVVLQADQPVGAALPRTGGGLVLVLRDGVAVVGPSAGDEPVVVAPIEADLPDHLMNDAKCDPAGRLWAGTYHVEERPFLGSLYRVDADHTSRRVLRRVSLSNGLGWDIAGTRMYYVDSPTNRVDVFDYDVDTGTASGRRPFVSFAPADDGSVMPDGLATDVDGGVWVAFWGGSRIERYRADGTLDVVVELPVSQVTSCGFGGQDLGELFVTTAALDAPDEVGRGAGGLFRLRPGTGGVPVPPFQG